MAKQRSQPKVGDRIAWRYPQFDAETDTPSEEPDWFYGTVTEATSTSVGVVFDDGDRCEGKKKLKLKKSSQYGDMWKLIKEKKKESSKRRTANKTTAKQKKERAGKGRAAEALRNPPAWALWFGGL